MNAKSNNPCPRCGNPLPGNVLDGGCPNCLMQMNLAEPTRIDVETAAKARKPKAPSPEEIAPLFPQLEIIKLIGQGGMGAVYKARQKELDRIVALKILPREIGETPGFAERFTREARALAKLNHPGIVTLYEFGKADGLYFFLMEYVDGLNLRLLLQNGRIEPREALAIVPQICDALQYAHDHGIVHRDIKPENLLLDRLGKVKVADFGLAKIVEGRDGSASRPSYDERTARRSVPTHMTEAGNAVLGTPKYMSPEQIEAPGTVDHRADIYALGVVFYQMLTGEMPDKELTPPSSKVRIDVRLDEVVLRALEHKPDLRYQQASILKTEVETIVGSASSGMVEINSGKTQTVADQDKHPSFWAPSVVIMRNNRRVVFWPGVLKMAVLYAGICAVGFIAAETIFWKWFGQGSLTSWACGIGLFVIIMLLTSIVRGFAPHTPSRGKQLIFIGVLILTAGVSTLLHQKLRPRAYDGQIIGAKSPDGMYNALGLTWHATRILGPDRILYTFIVCDKDVSGRSKPATNGQIKTSQFEVM